MKTKKNPTMYFLKRGSHIRTPEANCKHPKVYYNAVGKLSINEQGGSRKAKNLSAPTLKIKDCRQLI